MSENSNWTRVKIGDIVDSISENNTVAEKPVVLINTSDVLEGKVLNHLEIKNENLKGQFKKSFKKNDTLLSEIRPINNRNAFVNFNPDNYIASTKLMVLRPKYNNLKHKYLYYLLTSKNSLEFLQALAESRSGTFPQITFSTLSEIEISLPPIEEQNSIVNILSSFDDKIENNNAIIANLEEQAQAIFKSWFVDFEPFQDGEFKESELGNIPSFWQVVEANDWFKINIGKTPPRKQSEWFSTNPNDIKWLSISDMKNIQTFANKTSEYLTNEAVDKFNVRIAPANSVLLSFKLTIGRVAITRDELTTNEAIAHFHTNKHMELYYLYIYLNTFNYNKLGNTSSIGNAVNSKIIKAMPILKPNDKTLMKFHTVIEPLFNMIYEKVKENEKLETIRDILLPHLMSGEIRVEEAIEVEEM